MAYLYSKLYWKYRGCLSLFRKTIFKYKVTYPMQTDSKFAIFFLSLDMYLNGKEKGLNKLGEFNYIYKSLMISARQTRLLPEYVWTI